MNLRSHRGSRWQRGSGIIVSMVVVLVISIIGVALIRITARELAGATSARQAEALAACAEAGRQVILSQFRKSAGVTPVSLAPLNVNIDSASGANTRVMGGHVDQTGTTVKQVTVLPNGVFGATRGPTTDLTNIIGGTGNIGSGTPYKIVVHCVDHGDGSGAGGRQLEVEFGVKFGF